MLTRALGYRRAPNGGPRDRDARHHLGAAPVPSTSDLRQLFGPALDQGGLSTCVENAIADATRAVQVRLGADPGKTPLLSRLALYWLTRAEVGEQDMDSGSFIHLAFEAMNTFGFAPETVWPYTDAGEQWKRKPPLLALEAAFDQRDDKRADVDYRRILTSGGALVDDVKRALGNGMPVIFGVDVPQSFVDGHLGPGGVLSRPGPDDAIAGGHAMLLGGHAPGYAWARTSWGDAAFDHGWFKIAWDYIETAEDVWMIASCPLYSEESL